jgi:hypothetical protein
MAAMLCALNLGRETDLPIGNACTAFKVIFPPCSPRRNWQVI